METERIEETISAALDGEPVDLDELRQALATTAGREALAAFVLLRSATASDAVAPLGERAAATVAQFPMSDRRPRLAARYRVVGALAASLAALAVVGSFWLGSQWQTPQLTVHVAPPASAPAAVGVPTARVAADPLVIVRPCPATTTPQPPTPTRVVRYVSGVDWRDGTTQ